MTAASVKAVRCAIYTRVSTDNGLDQEFNSLDAQYDAASSYIRSQAHAGWSQARSRYDDGGYSGGSTERPALQRLLQDIRARKIDVIVVYKVDRLTRSLADFAKLVELFDANGVSFVSVTQQFNTTTSMGRLTLNVLLSFAQFEREVTSERIRDKIAASKRKGIWVGGNLPLGYEMKDGKITVIESEAEVVRTIFRRYLEVGAVRPMLQELRHRRIFTKSKLLSTGRTRGGIPFGHGTLYYLLRNRFYIGEVTYKGEILPGEQPTLMQRALFEAVQQKLTDQRSHRTVLRNKSDHLLTGLLFDDAGLRMVPTHATKAGIRYRYYVSSPHLYGPLELGSVGSVSRVPAPHVEDTVVSALNKHLAVEKISNRNAVMSTDREAVLAHIVRIDVKTNELTVKLKPQNQDHDGAVLSVAWEKPPSRRFKEILLPHSKLRADVRPIRAERRTHLVTAIARGRRWLNEIVSGEVSTANEIAIREKCSVRQVNLTITLAFLAPGLVKAAIEGRLPRSVGVERLRDAPPQWTEQFAMLGLNPQ